MTPSLKKSPKIENACFKLITEDKEEVLISELAMKHSKFLTDFVSNFGFSPSVNGEKNPIQIQKVTGPTLKLIVKWCEHHKNDPKIREMDYCKVTAEWDQQFLQMDNEVMFDLVRASNFLDVRILFAISTKTIATWIKGKNSEQLRAIFGGTPSEKSEEKRKNSVGNNEKRRKIE
ncbi:Protein CBG02202 [Caenorhabditis briggsae]|uniref:Skp1-related protein n=1 Tax=Caenorhabditis briggsae TaxID=6238 RepID=A8WSA7_CAEBR|nr:Protein CBG02202 [Caenorhabditis briggsae]CAP23365.1 Protein CBG02202 [Caenorhabditis briggsae]